MSLSSSEPTQYSIQADQLQIRRMRAADVPAVMSIESVSFGRHHWSDESFYNEINNQIGRYYALMDTSRQQLIGYCGFWLIVDEAHVTTIAVQPEYRGNSLGELLLVQMIERCMAQSMHWLTLEVRVSNYSAQNLYYKYGFASVGTRPKYYQDNQEDALIMTTSNISSQEFRDRYRTLKAALNQKLGGWPAGFSL